MSYIQDDEATQIRDLKNLIDELQAQILAVQSSVQLENVDSGQNIIPGANPSARGGSGGGSGQTNPEIRPFVDHGTVGLATEQFDLSAQGGNFHKIILSGDIGVAFDNPPGGNLVERFVIHFQQDGFGGHDVTSWPGTLQNPPTIGQGIDETTKVEFYTFDQGVTYHAFVQVSGTGTGGTDRTVIDLGTRGNTDPVTPEVVNLDISGSRKFKITLDGHVRFTVSGESAALILDDVFVEINQDMTGGWTVVWPLEFFAPLPVVAEDADSRTVVVFYTLDNGLSFVGYVASTSTGGSGVGNLSGWSNFPAVSDVDMDTWDIFDVDKVLYELGGSTLNDVQVGQTANMQGGLISNILSNAGGTGL